ncbi:endoplasmic reticulum membrane protein [Ceratobasidium sp. AG-Ba]|nr:endoplasmic reticulum membrane protein [Ceratobasidium sp. AG-Ba]
MPSKLFDVNHQLAFYGAYHSNKINIAIHIICVPIILWQVVFLANAGIPSFMPDVSYQINQYLAFEPNWAFIFSMIYIVYYYALEPVAAALYTPQFTLSCLSAIAFAQRPDAIKVAGALHAFSWIMQFIGHGAAEGRAPALLDNLVGAIVLAPFFVHLELLFAIGYKPSLHKRIQNEVGKQITQFRRQEADKKRAAGRKDL